MRLAFLPMRLACWLCSRGDFWSCKTWCRGSGSWFMYVFFLGACMFFFQGYSWVVHGLWLRVSDFGYNTPPSSSCSPHPRSRASDLSRSAACSAPPRDSAGASARAPPPRTSSSPLGMAAPSSRPLAARPASGFRLQGLGFRVYGLGLRMQGSGNASRVQTSSACGLRGWGLC
ncbi:hypothetical protein T484DRAFT_2601405 [Baffinella frigidus]|nr:hypothetical protein T484DRAFT_2601405 [Cryptophyta sp. CCMP2293]